MMAHQEACQLYIEQEVKEGLAQGKTPYAIGKELSVWVKKLFATSIPVETLKSRAARIKKQIGSNEPNHTTPQNHSVIPENQVAPPLRSHRLPFTGKPLAAPGRRVGWICPGHRAMLR
jgi:hypothetical protein